MSWGMVAGAVIGGVVSAANAKSAGAAANRANKGAGSVDVTNTTKWAPETDHYRDAGMQSAYNALYGFQTDQNVAGDPRAAAQPTGANGKPIDLAKQAKQKARIDAAKKGGATAPAGPAAPAARKFDGMSGETDQIREQMMKLPEQNAGMYNTSERFLTDTLDGTERNAYRADAADAAHQISDDPELASYQAAIRKSLGIDGGSSSSGGNNSQPRFAGGMSQAAGAAAPAGGGWNGASATGTDAALRKLVAGENPAGWDQMEAGISRKVNEGRAATIRELRARAVGSGFYGGDMYQSLEEGAIAQGDQEMTDSLAAARFGAYQNALGLGTQYDTSMADIASRERSSMASSSASAGAAAADAASRERLAMMGMWGDSIGMGQQGRTASAGALGDLAGMTSADQQAALQGVNALGASRRGDLGAAGDLSLGADSNRNNYTAAQRQQQAANASVNLGRQQLGFDRERFYDPFARISAYGNALNTFYGGYGSETTQGMDRRSQGTQLAPSVAGAGLQGAAAGAQIGMMFNQGADRTAPTTTIYPQNQPSAAPQPSRYNDPMGGYS